jgi:predicted DNA-binding protein
MASRTSTSIRVDLGTHKRIKAIAYLEGETMSEIIDSSIQEYLSSRPALRHRLNVVRKAVERSQEAVERSQGSQDGTEPSE